MKGNNQKRKGREGGEKERREREGKRREEKGREGKRRESRRNGRGINRLLVTRDLRAAELHTYTGGRSVLDHP
jgi:hypothetical protein